MHPAMAAAAAFFAPREDEGEVEGGGLFGGRFSAARPAVVTQQFFPTTAAAAQPRQQAVERCVLAGAAVAAAVGAGRWSRPASRAKSRRGPRSRSSQYRGVTFYRRTGRWESHIWDCGKQVYLGGFDTAHAAARAYDQAAIKFRGVDADINFSLDEYKEDINKMSGLSKQEFVQVLRRQGAGFVRGSSRFRGVTLHKCGKWEARIGQLMGKKFVYLGLYDTEMDAAKAYDKAAMDSCGEGEEAVTNFEEPEAVSTCDGEVGLQARGSEPDLELSLGCSGGGGGNDPTIGTNGGDNPHAATWGSQRMSPTIEKPEEKDDDDKEETAAACYPHRNRQSIWIRPSSRAITLPRLALGCPDGDRRPTTSSSAMLHMVRGIYQSIAVTDEQGQISGGGRAEAEVHVLGWPTGGGNHWQPYAAEAAAASSGFPPAPGLGAAAAGGYSFGQQWR